ncbi:MAG: HNH endonuclease signature motif containing protein [Gordonia sp. (in: high G+C Gram-positive bacteria)]|uniref:HNH endonuclease signature motif containing protein n=1 Tax=Gordonia TaxID=2053 RepID=UPI003263E4A0
MTVGLVVCEAAMRRVVLDAESAPLDVGREHRLVTVALRKALEARDRGCAFPGCGRPVSWTDAHHCVPWSQGGETAVDNCVPLCRMHHTVVHHTGWEVFIGHDRHPWFQPPADPARPVGSREPIRSNARRTMTTAPTAAA